MNWTVWQRQEPVLEVEEEIEVGVVAMVNNWVEDLREGDTLGISRTCRG